MNVVLCDYCQKQRTAYIPVLNSNGQPARLICIPCLTVQIKGEADP